MKFDIGKTLEEMLQAMQKETGKGWKKISAVSLEFANSNQERLAMITQMRLDKQLTEEEFLQRLEDEKLLLEAQLNALQVVAKATIQKAVNGAFKILENAIAAIL